VDAGSKRIIGRPESVHESFPQLPYSPYFFRASATCDHTLIASTSKVKRQRAAVITCEFLVARVHCRSRHGDSKAKSVPGLDYCRIAALPPDMKLGPALKRKKAGPPPHLIQGKILKIITEMFRY
jgi:hypothetical protein